MQIVTVKQMVKIENESEKLGVSKKQLMQNAGTKLAEVIMDICHSDTIQTVDPKIVFLAGSGNNGGDCFVAAERLVYRGYNVSVVNLIGEPTTDISKEAFAAMPDRVKVITGYRSENVEAAIEAAELDYMTIQDKDVSSLKTKSELTPVERILLREKERMSTVRAAVIGADILVDGVFGTGFHGELEDDIKAIFSIGTGAYKIAADVPSGGNCANGSISPGIFKADETVCFGCLKTGMTQFPLKKYCGKITVADIGIPFMAMSAIEGEKKYIRLDRKQLAGFPRKRERDAHKGTFGTVLIIAGSNNMRGAAAFAVQGALRSGAGIVRLASVEKCVDTVSLLAPEATFITLESDDNGFILFDDNKDALIDAIQSADAIVIGCGMGVTPDTLALTRFVLDNAKGIVIVDADGINCIVKDIDILMNRHTGAQIILTPHPGEMARLLKSDPATINGNRFIAAEKFAENLDVIVVLKGAGTLVAAGKVTAVNHTGNAGMSRGGSGDILAGIIGSVAAQGYDPFDAACAGVYIHGLAGDAAADKFGQEAMLPSDMISCLSDAFRILKEKQRS
ncbi:MAG: NAD(P)H-hydrate dehydratase [Ruminococcus sp.]|nr:NAD(P)H-hydrate dehydratase [Ruminococcus sp.]